MGLMQKLRGMWDRIRLVLVALLTALVLLFALQNLHAVPIDVLFWQVQYSASLLVLGSFLAGLAVGGVATFYYKGRFSAERRALEKAVAAAAVGEQTGKALPAEATPEPASGEADPDKQAREPRPPGGRR